MLVKSIFLEGMTRLGLLALAVALAAPAMAADPQQDELTEQEYWELLQLRRETQTGNEALAAIGCDQAAAEKVLGGLRSWHTQNKAQLTAAETQVGAARKALADARRRIRIGPRNEELLKALPDKIKALKQAAEARETLLDSARAVVKARMTETQQQAWEARRANSGLPSKYQYAPSLTAEQRMALRELSARSTRRMLQANTSELASLRQESDAAESRILTAAQTQAVAAAKQNLRQNRSAVARGAEAAIPMPESIRKRIREEQEAIERSAQMEGLRP